MRIIHHHQRPAAAAIALGAPGYRFHALQRPHRILKADVTRQQGCERPQQVGGIEAADKMTLQGRRAPRRGYVERQTIGADAQIAALHTQHAAAARARRPDAGEAISHHARIRTPHAGNHVGAEFVVEIEYRVLERRPAEEPGLRRAVTTHRAVIVEVVARDVGQQRDVEFDSGEPVLLDAVRGNFHAHRTGAAPDEFIERAMQPHRVRRGVQRCLQCAGKTAAEHADHRAFAARARERLRDPVAARSLPIGAGDANHP